MRLNARIAQEDMIMDSDIVPLTNASPFPSIDLELAEQTASTTRVYRMRILAVPESPSRDLDHNGAVNQSDFALFEPCMSGPNVPYAFGCITCDFDVDGDVDQTDFGLFQQCLGATSACH
jgi:hypothetical protein